MNRKPRVQHLDQTDIVFNTADFGSEKIAVRLVSLAVFMQAAVRP